MFKLFCTLIACGCLSVPSALSQEEPASKRNVGISASIQDNQYDILLPIWTSDHFSLAPAFGLIYVQDAGTDTRLGLVARYYLKTRKVSPFIGARGGVLLASAKDTESRTDYLFGLMGGAEYFFDESFSVGVEGQLNASFSDKHSNRYGNPGGTNINTGAAVFVSVYF